MYRVSRYSREPLCYQGLNDRNTPEVGTQRAEARVPRDQCNAIVFLKQNFHSPGYAAYRQNFCFPRALISGTRLGGGHSEILVPSVVRDALKSRTLRREIFPDTPGLPIFGTDRGTCVYLNHRPRCFSNTICILHLRKICISQRTLTCSSPYSNIVPRVST